MSLANVSAPKDSPQSSRDTSRYTSPEELIQARSQEGPSGPNLENRGLQMFESNLCYYLCPAYFINLNHFSHEPRDLLRWPYEDGVKTPGIPPVMLDDLTYHHLPVDQEDMLHNCYFKAVLSFVGCSHYGGYVNEVSSFRTGKSTMPGEVKAFMFEKHALTVLFCLAFMSRSYLDAGERMLGSICNRRRDWRFIEQISGARGVRICFARCCVI